MIKILHITSNRDGNIGGAEKLLLDLHSRFDPAEFEISYANVLSLGKDNDPYVGAMVRDGRDFVNIKGTGTINVPGVFLKLKKIIQRRRPDIVHTHLLHGSLLGQLAARRAGTKARILTRHFTIDSLSDDSFLRLIDKISLKTAQRVIAVSSAVRDEVIAQGIPPHKVQLVHNGVDLERFIDLEPGMRRSRESFVLGTVGSLTPAKGHTHLLEALRAVLRCIPKVKLIVMGDGVERANLERFARESGIASNVEFVGFTANVPMMLRGIDLYVHPSNSESFGIAIVEAMAARKCVIAANVGGVSEIVRNMETGILVPQADADELAQAVIWAYRHPEEARKMGDAGRQRVESHFDLKTAAAQYAEIYRLSTTEKERV